MDTLVPLILILIILELFEAWWQRSNTMMEVLELGYHYYQKSIFLFFLMHPSFYYMLFVILFTQVLNGWMVTILLLKSVDLFFKITMMQNIFVKNEVDEMMGSILYEPLSPWLFLTGVSLYPFLLFYALA